MPLTLEVVGEKASRMGRAARKTFVGGETIGRLNDNDWVLPDEYISSHHAKILLSNGDFLIEDTSTNGVFLNSQQNRLTRNKPQLLRNGDTLFIDDYQVRVILERAPMAAPAPSYQPAYSNASRIPDDVLVDAAPGSTGVPNSTDPLALLGLQSAPVIAPGRSAASLQNNSPLSQHYRPPEPVAPPLISPSPKPTPPPGAIPDDYDPFASEDDPFADGPLTPPVQPAAIARPRPGARGAADDAAGSERLPAYPVSQPVGAAASTVMTGPVRIPKPGSRLPDPLAVTPEPKSLRPAKFDSEGALPDPFDGGAPMSDSNSDMAPLTAPPPQLNVPPRPASVQARSAALAASPAESSPAAPPLQKMRPSPPVSAPLPPSRAAPSFDESTGERRPLAVQRAASGGTGDLDFAALLEAAGIDGMRVTPELSQQFGAILRVVVAGLMDVLRARDKIKDEFRMRMTSFKQADNNPLKFSANVEDALHNLLVKRNAAYLGPVEAFEDAFLDVRNHQMAMLAGVRVAYEAMLAEFDPDRLQKEFDPQAKGANFLGGGAKGKYWELYRNRFRDMVKDADSSFRHLFGDDFAKAYEEQLSRLKAANRAGRK